MARVGFGEVARRTDWQEPSVPVQTMEVSLVIFAIPRVVLSHPRAGLIIV